MLYRSYWLGNKFHSTPTKESKAVSPNTAVSRVPHPNEAVTRVRQLLCKSHFSIGAITLSLLLLLILRGSRDQGSMYIQGYSDEDVANRVRSREKRKKLIKGYINIKEKTKGW